MKKRKKVYCWIYVTASPTDDISSTNYHSRPSRRGHDAWLLLLLPNSFCCSSFTCIHRTTTVDVDHWTRRQGGSHVCVHHL